MFLAAAVSAACSLKVIIPQHPAPVVRKCNVLCSARDHASVPPPLVQTQILIGGRCSFSWYHNPEPLFK